VLLRRLLRGIPYFDIHSSPHARLASDCCSWYWLLCAPEKTLLGG